MCPKEWERSQAFGLVALATPIESRDSSLSRRKWVHPTLVREWGSVRCRWGRLAVAEPLCDRMESGEEEAFTGRRDASRRNHFCRCAGLWLPTSERRKLPSGNFRSARDLEGAERFSHRQAPARP